MPPATNVKPVRKNLALLTLIVAVVLEIVDMTIVNTALPAISADLRGGSSSIQWVVAGYALSFALLLMAGGRLGDSFGYRRIFLAGVVCFTLASLACGLARSADELVIARVLQGAAAAIMSPQALSLIQVLFTPLERVSKLALFGLIGGLAAIAGPILGGLLIEANLLGLGWRLIFFINLPVGLLAFVSGWLYLPDARSSRPAGFDPISTILFGAAVLAILWPLTRADAAWGLQEVLSLVLAMPILVLAFRHAAHRTGKGQAALFDPALLKISAFKLGLGISIAFAAANAGFLLAFAFTLQTERGASALTTGLLHMPFGIGAMFGIAVLTRNLLPRYEKWVLVAGGTVMALCVGLVLHGAGSLQLAWPVLVPILFVTGLGMGTLSGAISPISVARVDRDHAGAASAFLKTAQQMGAAFGIAIVGSAYFGWARGAGVPASFASAAMIALLLALCIGFALRLPRGIFVAGENPGGAGDPAELHASRGDPAHS